MGVPNWNKEMCEAEYYFKHFALTTCVFFDVSLAILKNEKTRVVFLLDS